MSVTSISRVLSLGSIVCAGAIIFFNGIIKGEKIKRFVISLIFVKSLTMIFLFLFNNLGNLFLIKFLTFIDIVSQNLLILSIYPMIVNYVKSDTFYSKRKLVEYFFKDIGLLIGFVIIGKTISIFTVNYNFCLFISVMFMISSLFFMLNLDQIKVKHENNIGIIKYILENKVFKIYLFYLFISQVAYATALSMKMLTVTNYLNFSVNNATLFFCV